MTSTRSRLRIPRLGLSLQAGSGSAMESRGSPICKFIYPIIHTIYCKHAALSMSAVLGFKNDILFRPESLYSLSWWPHPTSSCSSLKDALPHHTFQVISWVGGSNLSALFVPPDGHSQLWRWVPWTELSSQPAEHTAVSNKKLPYLLHEKRFANKWKSKTWKKINKINADIPKGGPNLVLLHLYRAGHLDICQKFIFMSTSILRLTLTPHPPP